MTTIIGTNDFHSEVATAQGLLSRLRRWKSQGAVLIDAGDFFGGNAFHRFSGGRVERRLLAELYDAIVPGNHDLADLACADSTALPRVVCANLRPPETFAGTWVSSLLLPHTRPLIGIVGFIGEQAFHAAGDERDGYRFEAPSADRLRAERDLLLEAGAEVVLGVSHSGFLADVELQETHGLFDVILSGHCHSGRYYWASPTGRHHVVKAPECGMGLARIDVDGRGVHAVTVEWRPSLPDADADRADWLTEAGEQYTAWAAALVGRLPAAVPDRRAVATMIAEAAARQHGTLFLLNQGTIRTGLPQVVDREALLNCAPFDSPLVACDARVGTAALLSDMRAIGEEAVHAGTVIAQRFITTAYLAGRLGIPSRPVEPDDSIHSTVHTICGG